MRKKKLRSGILGCALVSLASIVHMGCDESSAIKEPAPNRGADASDTSNDGGGDGFDAGTQDCFDNPKTHFEIINACTNATKIAKNPNLPKLLPDGGLPPLD